MWAKITGWLKKYWKWIIFPVGLVGLVLTALSWGRRSAPRLDGSATKAIDDIEQANAVRDAALHELETAHKERLKDLSDEQRAELEELRNKPVEEVVEWFNNIR